MSRERCGYVYETARYSNLGDGCCWRPVWNETDRCVWHADRADKSRDALSAQAPRPGERLDGAVLRHTTLEGIDCLSGVVAVGADAEGATLDGATLEEADLRDATLTNASLQEASLTGALLENADLRDADLDGTNFRGARFYEADFSQCYVGQGTDFGKRVVYEREAFEADDDAARQAAFDAATWTYRTLQFTCRQNALINRTTRYFVREKDLRRRYAWQVGDYFHAVRAEGSRLLTGYGYSIRGILAASVVVILLFAVLFPLVGTVQESTAAGAVLYVLESPADSSLEELTTTLGKSLYLSLIAFTTLGIGDVSAGSLVGQLLAAVEALLGYVLLALLISVLSRRRYWL